MAEERASEPHSGDEAPAGESRSPTQNVDWSKTITIYVKNLPYQAKVEDVDRMFSEYGKVVHIEATLSRGFAFVVMDNVDDGLNAIEKLNGSKLFDVTVVVEKARRAYDPDYPARRDRERDSDRSRSRRRERYRDSDDEDRGRYRDDYRDRDDRYGRDRRDDRRDDRDRDRDRYRGDRYRDERYDRYRDDRDRRRDRDDRYRDHRRSSDYDRGYDRHDRDLDRGMPPPAPVYEKRRDRDD